MQKKNSFIQVQGFHGSEDMSCIFLGCDVM
jgi:hypothetical protein